MRASDGVNKRDCQKLKDALRGSEKLVNRLKIGKIKCGTSHRRPQVSHKAEIWVTVSSHIGYTTLQWGFVESKWRCTTVESSPGGGGVRSYVILHSMKEGPPGLLLTQIFADII